MTLPRVALRPFRDEDAERLWVLSQEAAYRRRLPDQVYANPNEALQALRWLRGHHDLQGNWQGLPWVLALCEGLSGALIGHVGASSLPGDRVEVGYAMAEAWQGRGLASEALRLWVRRLAEAEVAPEFWGIVEGDNLPSLRVLQAAGFMPIQVDERGRQHWRWRP